MDTPQKILLEEIINLKLLI